MGERSYQKGTTVSRDGITVHQLLTEEEFGVPAVVLKLVSNRSDQVEIRLSVPDLQVQRIGFHPDFEDEAWSVEGETLVFESQLEPESELMTLFAVEDDETAVLEDAIGALEIIDVEPTGESPDSDDTAGVGQSGQVDPLAQSQAGEDSAGQADQSVDGSETESGETTPPSEASVQTKETVIETSDDGDETDSNDPDKTLIDLDSEKSDVGGSVDGQSPTDSTNPSTNDGDDVEFESLSNSTTGADTTSDKTSVSESDVEENGSTVAEISTTALVDELVARVEDEELTAKEMRRLQATGPGGDEGRNEVQEAQISHLQSRVSDVETFTESIEGLFEHHGPPVELFDDFDGRLANLERDFEALRGEFDETIEQVDGVEPRLESVEATIEGVTSDVSAAREELEAVKANQESVETDIREIQTWRKKVTGALEAFMGE